jgi:glycosyltransferase involved in cell wall biosynthesis
MRILFLIPGMHAVDRGAEVALGAVATELSLRGNDVTVVGSGRPRPGTAYRFVHSPLIGRHHFERFPKFPPLRTEYAYEEATFLAGYLPRFRPSQFDITVSCSFPFVNWALTRLPIGGRCAPHCYVTENGDWPAYSDDREYRAFRCDALVCTNPVYYERNRHRWRSALIPNGIDAGRFMPGPARKREFGVPDRAPLVVMVSALAENKRILTAMRALARLPDVHMIVAGDGPLREAVDTLAAQELPGRFQRMVLDSARMPDLYRSADVVLHTSLWESFGNVYIEALACGTPVVAHRYEVSEWIVGVNEPGLVDTEDETAIAAAVERALSLDRASTVARASAVAQRFAWSTLGTQYQQFFDAVVADHRA